MRISPRCSISWKRRAPIRQRRGRRARSADDVGTAGGGCPATGRAYNGQCLRFLDDVVTALAARIERSRVDDEERGLHGITQLDEFPRHAAAAIKTSDLLPQLEQDAAGPG